MHWEAILLFYFCLLNIIYELHAVNEFGNIKTFDILVRNVTISHMRIKSSALHRYFFFFFTKCVTLKFFRILLGHHWKHSVRPKLEN